MCLSEQLEYLEDKLREYRFLDQSNADQKAVLLGQLDSVRRELLDVIAINSPRITFAKEILREVLNFAVAGDETPRSSPAAAASLSSRLPPGSKEKTARGAPIPPLTTESSLFSIISNSPKPIGGSGGGGGSAPTQSSSRDNNTKNRTSTKFVSTYENDVWESASSRLDKLAVPVPGVTTSAGGRGTIQQPPDAAAARSRRYMASTLSGISGGSGSATTTTHHQITDEDIYGPPPPAPAQQNSMLLRGSTAAAGGSNGNSSTSLFTAAMASTNAANSTTTATGAAPMSPASAANYGGMVRIRDLLNRAELGLSKVAHAQEQRRTPKVVGGGTAADGGADGTTGTEEWDGISPSHHPINNVNFTTTGYITPREGDGNGDAASVWGGGPTPLSASQTYSVHDWSIKAEPMQTPPGRSARSGGGGGASYRGGDGDGGDGGGGATNSSGSGGVPAFVGKIAGLAFVLGSIAAATMAATGTLSGGGSGSGSAQKKKTPPPPQQQHQHHRPSTKKRGGGRTQLPGDMPPWTEAAPTVNNSSSITRRKATPGNAGGSGRPSRSSRPLATTTSSSTTASRKLSGNEQAPVMHVHQPPSSGSFPTQTPPDVTAAMG